MLKISWRRFIWLDCREKVGRQRKMWLDYIKRWSGEKRYEQLKRKAEERSTVYELLCNLICSSSLSLHIILVVKKKMAERFPKVNA